MHGVRHLFSRESLPDDVCPIDGGVVHVNFNLFAKELLPFVPDNGVVVHRHTGIERTIDHGVAHRLHVNTVRANLIISMNLAIDGVCLVVEGKNLEGVGMHIQRILLREVYYNSTFRGHCIACRVVVLTIVARNHVLVDGVRENHIAIGIVRTVLGIMVDAVANERLALVLHHRASEEFGIARLGVVVAVLAIDVAGARRDIGRSDDMGCRRTRIII